MAIFHLAFPVRDLANTRVFYVDTLKCRVGRESTRWIDFDFFGNQISAHLVDESDGMAATNAVDGDKVPTRHFGAVLEWNQWHQWARDLTQAGIRFRIQPRIRFEGKVGEQATMFFDDPSGNTIELKAFKDPTQVFATS